MTNFENLLAKNGIESDRKPDKVAELTAKLDALMEYQWLTVRMVSKGVYEVVKEEKPDGDYTRPIQIPENGIEVEQGKWYYTDDPELPHEALQDAFVTPDDFNDKTWFDFVE